MSFMSLDGEGGWCPEGTDEIDKINFLLFHNSSFSVIYLV